MSTPLKHTKVTTPQTEMNRLYERVGQEQFLIGTTEHRVRNESYAPALRDTKQKEHLEYHRDGVLIAVLFRYTRADDTVRISPKMLLIDNIRYCS